ncbi:hypothetical protein [Algoriphagus resistens]|uniref:hypothetical protein n=1 Tax=Algoriphagus resistens TaxID=1750590 RepID=UPI0007167D12|nr:hypothetical protein [Algoriphagus resistens]
MKRFLLPLVLVLCYFSCSQKDNDTVKGSADFHLEIVDSIRIDRLGSLWIQDYDSISRQYIAVTEKTDQELIVFNDTGEITSVITIALEGPNAIHGIFSLSFRNSEIKILDSDTGFYSLNTDGVIQSKISLPYPYMFIGPGLGGAFNSLGNEIAYLRPINRDSITGGMEWMAEDQYTKPVLEVMDTLSSEIRKTMAFPQTSRYADGNFYFFPFPTVKKYADRWYLYFWKELKYFVYKEEGEELVLEKTVDLEALDAVLPKPLPFSEVGQYLELTHSIKPGYIFQLYRYAGKTIVIYRKGFPEDLVLQSQADESVELVDKDFAAVFDEQNNLVMNEIELPEGLVFSSMITEKGEILAKKNQDFFGVEEDFVVYYKLKLLN